MRAYFDTSVLVPAFLAQHVNHPASRRRLEEVRRGEVKGFIHFHAAAETWSVVSAFPAQPRPGVEGLRSMMDVLLGGTFTVIESDAASSRRVFDTLLSQGHRGGVVYDALHVEAARRAKVDVILTYDVADFRRLAPDLKDRIRKP